MSAIFGETLTFPQENGPEVELVVFGDEFYSRRETKDGYTVIYDDKLGQYGYAILCEGEFASSGIPILEAPPPELQPHLEQRGRGGAHGRRGSRGRRHLSAASGSARRAASRPAGSPTGRSTPASRRGRS